MAGEREQHFSAQGSRSTPMGVTESSSLLHQGSALGHCGHHLMESEQSWEQGEGEGEHVEQINVSLGHKATRLTTRLMSAV